MTGIAIPPIEINSILDMIVTNFKAQYGRVIDPATLSYSFIEARTDTVLGFEVATTLPGRYLRIRLYVTGFNNLSSAFNFTLESIENATDPLADQVYVALTSLSSSVFKGMKKSVVSTPVIVNNSLAFELEDGSGYFDLEDGSGQYEIETAP